MDDREIRVRGAKDTRSRCIVLGCIADYEREFLSKGHGEGARNGVVCTAGVSPPLYRVVVYHTKTAIVGLYQEAHQ